MFLKHTKWAIFWALIILILCGMPGRDIPHISFLELLSFDKFVHAGIFFVLMLLLTRGFNMQYSFPRIRARAGVLALLICVAYGGVLEVMQGTVFEERSADIFDFIANSFGAVMAWMAYKPVESRVLVYLIK